VHRRAVRRTFAVSVIAGSIIVRQAATVCQWEHRIASLQSQLAAAMTNPVTNCARLHTGRLHDPGVDQYTP